MLAGRAWTVVRRRIARPVLHGLLRPALLRRMGRSDQALLLGQRLRGEPGVFHPTCFASSRVLAEHMVARPLRGVRLLDMGTGSGPIAVVTAAAGAHVTACDVNPSAVALARANAAAAGLEVDVLESDLFSALTGRAFDVIVFNIPFYPTEPTSHYEAAFRAGAGLATVRRFADGAARHLLPGGRVVIIFSEDCDRRVVLAHFAAAGLRVEAEVSTRRSFELFHVVTFAHDADARVRRGDTPGGAW